MVSEIYEQTSARDVANTSKLDYGWNRNRYLMQNNPDIREYRFGTYRLSNQEQRLYHDGKALSLSTKIYYLLLVLVENAGQVLSKDEIIEAVWPGQVVTDTALAKQVLRLRKLLNDQNSDRPLIETHRGVGYRFTPQVETIPVEKPLFSGQDAPQHRSWMGFLVIAVILLASYILVTQWQNKEPPPPLDPDQTIGLAVLQMGTSSDWLNLGGVEYLSNLVSDGDLVYAIQPKSEWFSTDSREEIAIEVAGYEHINYSCLLDISEVSDQFLVRASLRDNNNLIASTEISAETLPLAFEETNQWIRSNLQGESEAEWPSPPPPTRDNYALQSYLQGLQALRAQGDIKSAEEYFRAAVNSDPDFLQAWAKLARSLTDLGQQHEALSIGLTLLERPGISEDDALNVEIHYVIARAYSRLREGEKAKEYLSKTRDVIAETENPYIRLDGLESLSMLASLENDEAAAESFGLESLALAREFYPVPNYLAQIHLQLAMLFVQKKQQDKLKGHAEEAIRLSEAGHNPNGIIAGYRYLNSHNFSTNQLDEGVQVAIQAEPFLDQSAASYDKAFFLQFSTMILNLRGHFDRAENYSNLLRELALESNNSMYEVLSDFTVFHRYYVQEQFVEARAYAQAMRARFQNDAVMISALPDALVIEATVAARIDDPQEAIQLLAEFEEKFGSSEDRSRNGLNRVRGHIAVRQGRVEEGLALLTEAEQALRSEMQTSVANYIGYEILEILLDHQDFEYQSVIDRLERNTEYDYLFDKLKAGFKAREGNYMDAALLMQENRLRANQLWKPEDQLLLEAYLRETGTSAANL